MSISFIIYSKGYIAINTITSPSFLPFCFMLHRIAFLMSFFFHFFCHMPCLFFVLHILLGLIHFSSLQTMRYNKLYIHSFKILLIPSLQHAADSASTTNVASTTHADASNFLLSRFGEQGEKLMDKSFNLTEDTGFKWN